MESDGTPLAQLHMGQISVRVRMADSTNRVSAAPKPPVVPVGGMNPTVSRAVHLVTGR